MFWFKLTDDEGDVTEVEAGSRDVLQWEESSKTNETYVELLSRNTRSMTKFYRLAWLAAKRVEQVDCSLKDFKERYELDVSTEDPKPDPTQPEPSTEE